MTIEKEFQTNIQKLRTDSDEYEFAEKLKKTKQSVFFKFANDVKNDRFIQALEAKIEAIIISNSNHKQATKLIMELVWVTRNKWKHYNED